MWELIRCGKKLTWTQIRHIPQFRIQANVTQLEIPAREFYRPVLLNFGFSYITLDHLHYQTTALSSNKYLF